MRVPRVDHATGKVPDRYPLIDAHPSSILDFRFHNTRSDLLGTCARESTVKMYATAQQSPSRLRDA